MDLVWQGEGGYGSVMPAPLQRSVLLGPDVLLPSVSLLVELGIVLLPLHTLLVAAPLCPTHHSEELQV